MFVIFSFSGQTASVSSGISLKVTRKIVDIIRILRGGEGIDTDYLVEIMHPYVRKCAHMGEFGVLFVLLFLPFLASTVATRAMAAAIFVSFIYNKSVYNTTITMTIFFDSPFSFISCFFIMFT